MSYGGTLITSEYGILWYYYSSFYEQSLVVCADEDPRIKILESEDKFH